MAFDLENLVDLALFARVVDARSFSRAAAQSGIAKSAVSRRIALLEKRLGLTLLRRSTRALAVTADGARLYEHCTRLVSAAADAEASVRAAQSTVRGLIRISAPVTFAQMFLARAVAAFQRLHEGVEVMLHTDDRFVDVMAGEHDIVIRIRSRHDGLYVAKPLAADRLVVAGAPAYLDARGRPARTEDLVHHECLHYSLVDQAAEWKFRGSDRRPVSVRPGMFATNDGTVLREVVLSGLGLGVLPYFMVARDVAAGRAELVLEGQRQAEVGILAVVATARGLPLRVRRLIEHLQRCFARPDWQRGPRDDS